MCDLLPLLDRIVGGTSIVRLIDGASLTSEEIGEKCAQGVRVLSEYRNIESMLLSDSVLARLWRVSASLHASEQSLLPETVL